MKPTFILILLFCFVHKGSAITERIRLGFFASPGASWAKPFGKDLTGGKAHFGADYGLMFEYWFAKNYGLSTGVYGVYEGYNIGGRDAFQLKDTFGNVTRTVNERYTSNSLALPIYLKLKTNDIKGGKFSVWGQLGFTVNFMLSMRATYDNPIRLMDGSDLTIEKEKILKSDNDVARAIPGFKGNLIDFRLGVGAGFEYKFDSKSSLLLGIFYHNGFVNNLLDQDAKGEPILIRFLSVRAGVLF